MANRRTNQRSDQPTDIAGHIFMCTRQKSHFTEKFDDNLVNFLIILPFNLLVLTVKLFPYCRISIQRIFSSKRKIKGVRRKEEEIAQICPQRVLPMVEWSSACYPQTCPFCIQMKLKQRNNGILSCLKVKSVTQNTYIILAKKNQFL